MYTTIQCTHHAFRQDGVDFTDVGPENGYRAHLCKCTVGQHRNQVVIDLCLYPTNHE